MAVRQGPEPLPGNFFTKTLRGFFYPLEAVRFIFHHKLWGLTGFAIGVNVVLLLLLGFTSWYFLDSWLGALDVWLDGLVEPDWAKWFMGLLSVIAYIVAIILAVVVNALAVLLLGQAVASPFLDMLSEKVEHIVISTPEVPFSAGRAAKSIALALSDLLWSILLLISVNLPVWLIGMMVPPVAAVAIFAFAALLLAHEFISFPLVRHLVSYRKRWSMVWRHKWLSLGFGMAAMLLLLVPGINLVLLPLVTVGGTLLYCDVKAAGDVEGGAAVVPAPSSRA